MDEEISRIDKIFQDIQAKNSKPISQLNLHDRIQFERKKDILRKKSKTLSKELLAKLDNIDKIGYHGIFQEIRTAIGYGVDHEIIICASYSHMGKYFPDSSYQDLLLLLKDYETILKYDPSYRDHLFHTFHVFMVGCCIINEFYDRLSEYCITKCNSDVPLKSVETVWLLIASFHDISIPIQKSSDFTDRLFESFFGAKNVISMNFTNTEILDKYYEYIIS